MFLSISLIIIFGLLTSFICKKIKLPGLIGMLLTGIILGPYCLNLLDGNILNISGEIRKIALIIILTRAGLTLDISGLKKIGRPAFLMCFLPASFELLGVIILVPKLLGLSLLEAALVGAVLSAVSPAVVVPRMVEMIDNNHGTKQGIPQLILAGASVDDIYVIVLFTTFLNMSQGKEISVLSFVNIPVSIILGIIFGLCVGFLLSKITAFIQMRPTIKVLLMLSFSLMLVAIEDQLTTIFTFSSLIAIMFIGIGLQKWKKDDVKAISEQYNKLWVGAEIFLFVLVGATVDISYLGNVGLQAFWIIVFALVFRMFGVFLCLVKTDFKWKERIFIMVAYTPKATVQAAIGGIPLSVGLACGNSVLTIAVLAIVLTAPLGAFAIDLLKGKLIK